MPEDFTAKFRVDISDLKKNITEAQRDIKLADATFKAATAGMDSWAKDADGLAAKLKQLNSTLTSQKTVLNSYKDQLTRQQDAYTKNGEKADALKAKLQELADQGVKKTDEEYQKYSSALKDVLSEQQKNEKACDQLKLSILNQQAAVGKTEKEIRHYEEAERSLGDGAEDAKKDVKELGDATKTAGDNADKGSKGFTIFKGIVADLASSAIKSAASGLKELGKGVIELGKQSLEGFAEMEQLKGGVEKLFGDDMTTVIENANSAFKSAGMDANAYMETVTGVSAALISSLGGDTAKAAELADVMIQDMSDNANVFGSSMEDVQAVYTSLSKGQYQTLDNLKLGYAGTKTGMQELMKEAERLDDTFVAQRDDAGNLSMEYSDMVKAIHVVQKNMNITGTTAKEASKTISGSINSTKAAWKNLISSLGDPSADVKKLAKDVISSAGDVVTNVLPVVENISDAVPTAIDSIIQEIEKSDLVGKVIDTAGEVADSLFKELPSLLGTLGEKISEILPGALQTINTVTPGIVTSIFDGIANIIENIDLGELVKGVFDCTNNIIKSIIPRIPELLVQLTGGVIEALPELFVGIGETIYTTLDSLFSKYNEFDKFQEKIDAQTEAWKQVKTSMEQASAQINSDAATWEQSWEMLKNMTDSTGKVKAGYEGMAQVLVDQLNEQLGANIEIIDDQIQGYEELSASIMDTINKKRAELILEQEEQAYNEAVAARAELVQQQAEAQEALAEATEKADKAEMEMNQHLDEFGNAPIEYALANEEANQAVAQAQAAYDSATANLENNTALQSQYLADYAAAVEGNWSAIGESTRGYVGSTLQDVIEYRNGIQSELDQDKINQQSWLDSYKETHKESDLEQANYYAQRIAKDQEEINKINELIKKGGTDFSAGYVNGILSGESDVEDAGETITTAALHSVQNTQKSHSPSQVTMGLGEDFGEGYKLGINSKSGTVNNAARGLSGQAKSGLREGKDSAYGLGESTGSGFANGIGAAADSVWNAAKRLANNVLSSIRSAMDIHSPSKETQWLGEMVSKGLAEGISDGGKEVIREATRLASSASDALKISAPSIPTGSLKNGIYGTLGSLNNATGAGVGAGNSVNNSKTTTFTQNIYAPKQPSRLELYRQTKNLLALANGGAI